MPSQSLWSAQRQNETVPQFSQKVPGVHNPECGSAQSIPMRPWSAWSFSDSPESFWSPCIAQPQSFLRQSLELPSPRASPHYPHKAPGVPNPRLSLKSPGTEYSQRPWSVQHQIARCQRLPECKAPYDPIAEHPWSEPREFVQSVAGVPNPRVSLQTPRLHGRGVRCKMTFVASMLVRMTF